MVFFVEAGNSGDSLLDSGQPIFTLLSHDFGEEKQNYYLIQLEEIRMRRNCILIT